MFLCIFPSCLDKLKYEVPSPAELPRFRISEVVHPSARTLRMPSPEVQRIVMSVPGRASLPVSFAVVDHAVRVHPAARSRLSFSSPPLLPCGRTAPPGNRFLPGSRCLFEVNVRLVCLPLCDQQGPTIMRMSAEGMAAYGNHPANVRDHDLVHQHATLAAEGST